MTDAGERRRARTRGRWAETVCVWWLRLTGWRVLAHGYVTGRGSGAGEVDIVARRGTVLAFVEVKARADHDSALAAVSARQRRRIHRAAQGWLKRHPQHGDSVVRFDVMVVLPWRPPRRLIDAWREDG